MLLVLVMTINPSNIACNNLVGCVIKLRPNCLLIREPIKRGKDPQMCHKNKFFFQSTSPILDLECSSVIHQQKYYQIFVFVKNIVFAWIITSLCTDSLHQSVCSSSTSILNSIDGNLHSDATAKAFTCLSLT